MPTRRASFARSATGSSLRHGSTCLACTWASTMPPGTVGGVKDMAATSVGLVAGDERLEAGSCDIVGALFGRGLHQVRTGRQQRTPDATVQGDPGGPDRVDDDACGVRRVPHLELVLQVDRDV